MPIALAYFYNCFRYLSASVYCPLLLPVIPLVLLFALLTGNLTKAKLAPPIKGTDEALQGQPDPTG